MKQPEITQLKLFVSNNHYVSKNMNSRSHNNSFDDCGLPIFLNPLCSYEAYNVIFLSFFQVCSFFHNEVSPDREHRYIFFPCNVTSISSNLLFNQFNLINNLQS